MALLDSIGDSYSIRARVAPSALVFLPLGFALASWWPGEAKLPGVLAGMGATLALGTLFSQIGRDLGKAKQRQLFEKWGGVPTTMLLSHGTSTLNPHTLARCHEVLRLIRPDIRIPASRKEEEGWGAVVTERVYETCTDSLREISRDKVKYPLVFEENVNFGFRRNLWAMKPAAIIIAAVSMTACLARVWLRASDGLPIEPMTVALAVVCTMLLVIWCVRITRQWVRTVALSYAERLIGVCETLNPPKPESKLIA